MNLVDPFGLDSGTDCGGGPCGSYSVNIGGGCSYSVSYSQQTITFPASGETHTYDVPAVSFSCNSGVGQFWDSWFRGGGGSGTTIGPAPKPPKVCSLLDAIQATGAFDEGFGLGLGVKSGLFSADVSWWKSQVNDATHADASFNFLTIGAESSSHDPTGQWDPEWHRITDTSELKFGPYRYDTNNGSWSRGKTTLGRDLFKTEYGASLGFFKVKLDVGKISDYLNKNGCQVVTLW